MKFFARLVLSSNSGYSKKRVSFFHSASAYWQALLSALEGKAEDCAALILLRNHRLESTWKSPEDTKMRQVKSVLPKFVMRSKLNPTLSATQSEVQRNPPGLLRKFQEMGAISQLLLLRRTGRSVLLNDASKLCGLFLRRASEQSGFTDALRRMQFDQKPIIRRKTTSDMSQVGLVSCGHCPLPARHPR